MRKDQTMAEAMDGRGCLGKSKDDEPVFVLVGRDKAAPFAIRRWADEAAQMSAMRSVREGGPVISDTLAAKIDEARACADEMDRWREAHGGGKIPD